MMSGKAQRSWFDDSQLSERDLNEYLQSIPLPDVSDGENQSPVKKLMDIKDFPENVCNLENNILSNENWRRNPSPKVNNGKQAERRHQRVLSPHARHKKRNALSGGRCSETGELVSDMKSIDASKPASVGSVACIAFKETTPYIDSLCHFDDILAKYATGEMSATTLLKKNHLRPSNYVGAVQCFSSPAHLASGNTVVTTIMKEGEDLYFTYGFHPRWCHQFNDDQLKALQKCLTLPRVKAVGEIGLDYSNNQRQEQKRVLSSILGAIGHLPIVLVGKESTSAECTRNVYDDLLEVVKEILPTEHKIYLHAFTGNYEQAERWISKFPNVRIGVTPVITSSNRRYDEIRETVQRIPLDRLMIETDSADFVPEGMEKESKYSLPWFSIFVAEKIANLRNVPLEVVLSLTTWNAVCLYDIDPFDIQALSS